MGRVAAPKPSRAGRQGSEPWDAWRHWIPIEQGGGVQSHETHDDTGALLCRVAESDTTGYVTCGCTPCFLPWFEACM
jgi:hypothetical protein